MRKPRSALTFAPLLAVVLASCASPRAGESNEPEVVEYQGDYPQYDAVDQLCQDAELVAVVSPIRSEVREVDISAPPGDTEVENPRLGTDEAETAEPVLIVQTVTTVRVDAVARGKANVGDELEIGQPGGLFKDVLYEADAYDFDQSKQSLVFLDVWPNDVPASPLNPTQAAYAVSADGAVVTRDTGVSGLAGVESIADATAVCGR